ncbi:MAG: MlaD family protein [Planctomycetales bacterium]|nr:MlaD family protein [Planctomycetales bacterium]
MKQDGTYFKIGIFVLGCLAVLLAGLAWLSSSAFRGNPVLIETYINESVQGLSVGSAVMHRGVEIGRVKTITFVPLLYPLTPNTPDYETYDRYVVVIMEINSRTFLGVDYDPAQVKTLLADKVKLGLRFKLSYQGITGLAFMEADYFDNEKTPPLTAVPWASRNIYVPSTLSFITSFTQALENIYYRLKEMPIEETLEKMQTTLGTIDQAIRDAQLGQVSQSVVALADDLRKTNLQLQDLLASAQNLPDDVDAAARQLRTTLSKVEQLIDRNEPDVEAILNALKTLSQNLRQLTENLKADPAQLFWSTPPSRSEHVK